MERQEHQLLQDLVKRNFDVHACTPLLKQTHVRRLYQQPATQQRRQSHWLLQAKLKSLCPDLVPVINKMVQRTNSEGCYPCPDLEVDVWWLVEQVLNCVERNHKDRVPLLHETLAEMAGHCIQGDSHRLVCLLLSLQ